MFVRCVSYTKPTRYMITFLDYTTFQLFINFVGKWKGYLDLKKINTCTCVNTFYHIYKLWCYTGISGSEKSHNNTHEKTSYFFTCVDTANQLLTCHLPLAPLSQVDEWTAKPSWFLIKVLCWSFLELWRLKH